MGLEHWVANGWLKRHETSQQEIADLVTVADTALKNANVPGLTPDARIGLAWPAVLALGAAALAASGYRAEKVRHHERVIDSFQHTVQLDATSLAVFSRMRRMRNEMTYERVGTLTDQEALRYLEAVEGLRERVLAWLRDGFPHLVPDD